MYFFLVTVLNYTSKLWILLFIMKHMVALLHILGHWCDVPVKVMESVLKFSLHIHKDSGITYKTQLCDGIGFQCWKVGNVPTSRLYFSALQFDMKTLHCVNEGQNRSLSLAIRNLIHNVSYLLKVLALSLGDWFALSFRKEFLSADHMSFSAWSLAEPVDLTGIFRSSNSHSNFANNCWEWSCFSSLDLMKLIANTVISITCLKLKYPQL